MLKVVLKDRLQRKKLLENEHANNNEDLKDIAIYKDLTKKQRDVRSEKRENKGNKSKNEENEEEENTSNDSQSSSSQDRNESAMSQEPADPYRQETILLNKKNFDGDETIIGGIWLSPRRSGCS